MNVDSALSPHADGSLEVWHRGMAQGRKRSNNIRTTPVEVHKPSNCPVAAGTIRCLSRVPVAFIRSLGSRVYTGGCRGDPKTRLSQAITRPSCVVRELSCHVVFFADIVGTTTVYTYPIIESIKPVNFCEHTALAELELCEVRYLSTCMCV